MLFADLDPGTQNGVLIAMVGAVGTAFGLLVNLLRDRDKLRYDSKLQALETQNAQQAAQLATQATQIAACEQRHKECEESHRTMEARVAALECHLK